MLQSKLFPKTLREDPRDEISANAKFLVRAGFVDKLMAGVYTYLPLGLQVLKKIENIIREEMNKAGGQEILMPVLQPKENWVKTGRWDSLDSLFKFVSHYSKTEFALGPTHEEIISPLVAKVSISYKDLPLYIFQIQTKFRDEKRVKSGILRGREFLMKDLYSFHADEKDMNKYYEKMKTHYKNIFDKCGIGEKTYITFASGGSFSKYSHEYQTITEAGEDKIFLCEKCKIAINSELNQNACPECGNKDLKEKKAIEVGNIFPLKTKYSEPFGLKFTDKDGSQKDIIMGCYGIGLSRLMGAIAEINHDKKGIIWPESVAPFKVHLIEIGESAKEFYKDLQKANIEVLYDEREDVTAGEKFADADLIGIPYRIVVSEKTTKDKKVELKRRDSEKIKLIDKKELLKIMEHVG
ncbi:prolyl-tRNA synthetase [Patescibacteria group bacterium]|nr:prolyl-tRNA synthetase [Patescibacteria group bacterium]MBU2263419.1 prolyl-tRNA synthetase [Patescibacteria group bacterium]